MLEINRNIEFSNVENEFLKMDNISEKSITMHELNKKENRPVSLKILNNLPSGMILVDDLIKYASGLQDIFSKAINSKIQPNSKRVKNYIKDNTGLIISDVHPGSFIIELKQKRTQIFEPELNSNFETITKSEANISLDTLTDILNNLNEEKLINIIEKYDFKTFKSTKNWINNISRINNDFVYIQDGNKIDFSKAKINKIKDEISNLEYKENEKLKLSGKIIRLSRNPSIIEIEDLNSEEKFIINVADEKFKESHLSLNSVVSINVKIEEVFIKGTQVSSSILLDDINKIDILVN